MIELRAEGFEGRAGGSDEEVVVVDDGNEDAIWGLLFGSVDAPAEADMAMREVEY